MRKPWVPNSRSVISPKIWPCIHPFFLKHAPVSTPSSYRIRYRAILTTGPSYYRKCTLCIAIFISTINLFILFMMTMNWWYNHEAHPFLLQTISQSERRTSVKPWRFALWRPKVNFSGESLQVTLKDLIILIFLIYHHNPHRPHDHQEQQCVTTTYCHLQRLLYHNNHHQYHFLIINIITITTAIIIITTTYCKGKS